MRRGDREVGVGFYHWIQWWVLIHKHIECNYEYFPSLGRVPNGLVVHPDKKHLIYPLGCTVVVQDVFSGTQEFLSGHNDNVSCLACSPSGKYLASGQVGIQKCIRPCATTFRVKNACRHEIRILVHSTYVYPDISSTTTFLFGFRLPKSLCLIWISRLVLHMIHYINYLVRWL